MKLVSHHRSGADKAEILLVEDNPGDQYLAVKVFKEMAWAKPPHVVGNGIDALAFLRHQGQFRRSPSPDLILLDLGLPGMDGHEVLKEVKQDPDLRHIPIVVFTNSDLGSDVARSYALGAACHFTKPLSLDAFIQTVRNIERYWRASLVHHRSPLRRMARGWQRFRRRATHASLTQQDKAHLYWMVLVLLLFGVLVILL